LVSPAYRVAQWTSEAGLPQNTVTALCQTRQGYLWVGTRYGLARYDGVRWVDFSAELSRSAEDDLEVWGLAEDGGDRLWIATATGVVCYDHGRFSQPPPYDPLRTEPVRVLISRHDGGLWVARTNSIFDYNQGRMGHRAVVPPTAASGGEWPSIDRLIEDDAGRLWIRVGSVRGGGWHRFDPKSDALRSLTELLGAIAKDVSALWPVDAGGLWLGKPGELVLWENGRVSRYPATGAWDSEYPPKHMVVDARGRVWICTAGPEQLHWFRDGELRRYGLRTGVADAENVRVLLPGREGDLWVGTGSGGLAHLYPWQVVSMLADPTFASDEVYSIAPGRDGRVWLATAAGLVRYQKGQFAIVTNRTLPAPALTPRAGPLGRVRPVFETRSGEVLFGRDFEGLCRLRADVFEPIPGILPVGRERRVIRSLCEDAAGAVWIASCRGLARYQDKQCRLWTGADGLSDTDTAGLVAAPDGSVWVGTREGGVNRFATGRFRAFRTNEGLLSNHAWPLNVEADGTVWVGTPLGLNRIRGDTVRSVTRRQGLFDNLAYCLLDDGRSNYWTFGNRGLWRVSQADLHAAADGGADRLYCVRYGESDGMVSAEGNGDDQPNAIARANGELWFPTTRGVAVLDLNSLHAPNAHLPVAIEEVRIDGQLVFRDGGYPSGRGVSKLADRPLRLAPGRARVFEIHYTATTFADASETRFRYRLDGEDEAWNNADFRRVAYYTNLRPGRHRFQVEAFGRNGAASKQPAVFVFDLAPQLYQTAVFRVGCAVAVLACLWAWHVRRVRQLGRIEELERLDVLHTERNRIARDLHDGLGSSLTGISLHVDLIRRDLGNGSSGDAAIEALAKSVRVLGEETRDLVWFLDPRCDTLESFCARLVEVTTRFLRAAGLGCRLSIPENLPSRSLSAQARHHLIQIAREALANAARHANASEVTVALRIQPFELAMTIADNGRGLSKEENTRPSPGSGRGLANMRRRMESIGGRLELWSQPGEGTSVTARITLPGPNART
jgi:signal transduction histidine kinase/ligand-binding sensor domain-containing protein